MLTELSWKLAAWVLPVVLAPLVFLLAQLVLNAHRAIDDLPPIFKRVAVGVLGVVVAGVLTSIGVALPPECGGLPSGDFTSSCAGALSAPTVVKGVTAAAAAMFIHAMRKANPRAL